MQRQYLIWDKKFVPTQQLWQSTRPNAAPSPSHPHRTSLIRGVERAAVCSFYLSVTSSCPFFICSLSSRSLCFAVRSIAAILTFGLYSYIFLFNSSISQFFVFFFFFRCCFCNSHLNTCQKTWHKRVSVRVRVCEQKVCNSSATVAFPRQNNTARPQGKCHFHFVLLSLVMVVDMIEWIISCIINMTWPYCTFLVIQMS